ncbi:MAG: hypothetical protein SPF17_05520 [Candidatus Mucispirillum faecigallinarum]|nr:hypothetical protein [Candidatus Mucispirillum faecigallinarum]
MNLKQGHLELKFDEEKLRDVLHHLYAANKAVKVGILENAANADTGASIAEYAYWNEFGTKNIPPRPFFRNAISDNTDKWALSIKNQLKSMGITDKNVVEKALKRTGQLMRSDIQQSISEGGFKPLKPATIKRKGKATPLVDTGDMRNAISYEVTDSRGNS